LDARKSFASFTIMLTELDCCGITLDLENILIFFIIALDNDNVLLYTEQQ
jgi:hypothetical protein